MYFFINLFIYFCLCWVFVAASGISLVAASWGYSSLWCTGFHCNGLSLLRSTDSRCAGFSSCGTQAQQLCLAGSRLQAQQLWHTGLVAPQHVGSSQTRLEPVSRALAGRFLTTAPRLSPCSFFKESIFGFVDSLYYFSTLYFIYFCSNLYYFLFSAEFVFSFSSFCSSLQSKVRLLI